MLFSPSVVRLIVAPDGKFIFAGSYGGGRLDEVAIAPPRTRDWRMFRWALVPIRAEERQARGKNVKTFIGMMRDDRGASAAEYALILAIIGAIIAVAALKLSTAVGNAMDGTGACIRAPTTTNC